MPAQILDPATLLRQLFDRAVAVADPMRMLAAHLPPRPPGRVVVVGAGKASARMAEAVEAAWGPCEGLVITRHGHARPTMGIKVALASHPIPDAAGQAATQEMLALLAGLGPNDFVLALISGGASALLTAPVPGVTLAEKQAVTAALLASGAPIDQINTLRKHLSAVKGGQLAAAAHPAALLALMISDVPGDDPGLIGSGPTVGCTSTPQLASEVLQRWQIRPPASVEAALARPSGVVPPDDPRLARVVNNVCAAPIQSLNAAAQMARAQGLQVQMLGANLEGAAQQVAAEHARLALAAQSALKPGDAPLLLLSGGELTVTLTQTGPKTGPQTGIGGPNAEYCLALALALQGAPGIHAIACDTDGVDGAAEVAGAQIGPQTLAQARARGLNPAAYLAAHDAHSFFAALQAQVVTGPTLTNVNDFRAILCQPQP